MIKSIKNKLENTTFISLPFELFTLIFIALSISLVLLVHSKEIERSNDYLEGKQLIETIDFENLRTSNLSNGTGIKVSPSIEYPGDKLVEYKALRASLWARTADFPCN